MQHNRYSLEELKEIIQVFREVQGVKDNPRPHDYQILTYSRSDYEAVRKTIEKYSHYNKRDLMYENVLDVLFVIKYRSLPLWFNKGELISKLAGWRIKRGS